MKTVYLETSALLAWLFGDSRAPEAVKIIDEAEMVATSVTGESREIPVH